MFKRLRELEENVKELYGVVAKMAAKIGELEMRAREAEKRLDAIGDTLESGEIQKLKAEKDYIEGMYNMLNYDISTAKRPKGVNLDGRK